MNNGDYAKDKEKRDRAINYWKSRVVQDFLPPIDQKKKDEVEERKGGSSQIMKLLEHKITRDNPNDSRNSSRNQGKRMTVMPSTLSLGQTLSSNAGLPPTTPKKKMVQ